MKSTQTMFHAGRIPSRSKQREAVQMLQRIGSARSVTLADFEYGLPYFCEGNGCDNQLTGGRLCSECASDAR